MAANGADAIVLREKDLPPAEYEALAKEFLAVCAGYDTVPVLHGHVGLMQKLSANYLHLSIPKARELAEQRDCAAKYTDGRQETDGESFCLGVSVHSEEQLLEAQQCGAEYVFYGHVFATDCKKGAPPRGLSLLGDICRKASVPVYAIGGITPENALEAVAAGASGVCVMSWGMQKSAAQIREFTTMLHDAGNCKADKANRLLGME